MLPWDVGDCEPAGLDEVIEASGLAAARVSEILLDLEMRGLLKQLPGKRFITGR